MALAPRERFDAVADAYERSRPDYPAKLVDRLGAACRTLEIGCGSGQLTIDLLARGHHVVAVELGARLLAHASRRCPTADFVLGEFEQVDLGQQRFDLVVSATAFHWVDPWVGYRKAAALLSPTGRLALLSHRVVAGPGTDAFDEVVRRCAPSFRLGVLHSATALKATVQAAGAENISAVLEAIEERPSLRNDADRWFDSAKVSSVAWDEPLTSCQLLQAVAATSVWTVLPAHERAALTLGLQTMVDNLGGTFVRRRLTFLAVADRRTDE